MTPIHWVLEKFNYKATNLDFLRWLIEKGASTNSTNKEGNNTLHCAFKLYTI